MKKLLACLVTMMILTIGTAVAAPSGGIGILDMNKLTAESPKIRALDEQLRLKGQELYNQLAAEKPNLTPEQFKQKEEEAFKAFLQTKLNFEAQIDTGIRQAAEQVAKEKSLSLVIYKNSVVFGGTDITQDVIQKMK
jgi:outer membrane protein